MFALFLGAGLLCQPVDAAPLSPQDAVSLALSVHPQLRAAEAQLTQAAAAHARTTAPRYNPTLRADVALSGERLGFSLAQPITLTGQRRLQRQQTRAALDAATAQRTRARLTVAVAARSAYVEAAVAAATAQLARDAVALSVQLEDAARLRHAAGDASLLDLRLARLSRARSASWLLDASAQESTSLADLSAMLGQPITAADLTAEPLAVAPLPTETITAPRSDVRAATARLQAAEHDRRQQQAAALAPLSVGMFIEQEDAERFIGPSLGVTLPLFSRNQLGQAEAAAELQVAAAAQRAVTARAETEIATATTRHAEAEALLTGLGADLSVAAEKALDGIALSYETGQTDLLSTLLLQSEVMQGQAALIALQGQLADARLALLLALDDDALLGIAP
jgi:outer membrane protein, heavy metal efflux system